MAFAQANTHARCHRSITACLNAGLAVLCCVQGCLQDAQRRGTVTHDLPAPEDWQDLALQTTWKVDVNSYIFTAPTLFKTDMHKVHTRRWSPPPGVRAARRC